MNRSAESSAVKKPEGAKGAVRFVLTGYGRTVGTIAATAFLGGLLEALFLVAITRTAFAITNGDDRIALLSDRSVSVGTMLSIAVALIAVRIALAGYTSWQ